MISEIEKIKRQIENKKTLLAQLEETLEVVAQESSQKEREQIEIIQSGHGNPSLVEADIAGLAIRGRGTRKAIDNVRSEIEALEQELIEKERTAVMVTLQAELPSLLEKRRELARLLKDFLKKSSELREDLTRFDRKARSSGLAQLAERANRKVVFEILHKADEHIRKTIRDLS